MKRKAFLALMLGVGVASSALAGPMTQPPIDIADEFNAGLDPNASLVGAPSRTPLSDELGQNPPTSGPVAAPLPSPVLLGAAGLFAAMGIRRRWTERN